MRVAARLCPVWWFTGSARGGLCAVSRHVRNRNMLNEAFVRKLLASVTTSCKTGHSAVVASVCTLSGNGCLFRRTHNLVKEPNTIWGHGLKRCVGAPTRVAVATDVGAKRPSNAMPVCPVNALVFFSCINVHVCAFFGAHLHARNHSPFRLWRS